MGQFTVDGSPFLHPTISLIENLLLASYSDFYTAKQNKYQQQYHFAVIFKQMLGKVDQQNFVSLE